MRKLAIGASLILFIFFGCVIFISIFFVSQSRIVSRQFPLKQEWIFEADDSIRSTPVVYKDWIVVRTKHQLSVIDSLTGNLVWTVTLPEDWHTDPPIVQDDIIVVTQSKGTTALNLATGETIWEVIDQNTRNDAFPAIADERNVIIVDNSILIWDIKTGELKWEIQNPYARSDAIVKLDGRNLYVIFKDEIRHYDVETGESLWQDKTEEWSLQNGILDDHVLYLELLEDGLAAFDLKQRKVLWRRENLSLSDYPPLKYGNTIFIGTSGQAPVAIDASTGETLWEAQGVWDYDDYQTPLVLNKILYIRGLFQKKIYAIDVANGQVIGQLNLDIPDIVSANADYSLGPVQAGDLIIFPAGKQLLAYGK